MTEKILFRQIGLPIFQNKVYGDREAALNAATADVELVQNATTGLVHNRKFDAALMRYDESYQNEQACSSAFQDHLEQVAQILVRNFSGGKKGIEIGCGKGYFFEKLLDLGLDLTGYDPAYEGSHPRIIKQYFGHDVAAPPDYIILRHVLEHIPSPWTFLEQLASHSHPDTTIFIEAPCFDWIVKNRAFYGIFFEHPSYFTLDVLENAMPSTIESGHLFGGQYLYIIAKLAGFKTPASHDGKRYEELDIDSHIDTLLLQRRAPDHGAFVWGAGAKGITFSCILAKRGIAVDAIIDINPVKQGKFAGGSGVPIIAPQQCMQDLPGADVFVMNPVYLEEIKASVGQLNINWISTV